LTNFTLPEESGHRIFGEEVHHGRCGPVENGDGCLLNFRQTSPRRYFTGMAGDASFLIGKPIPEEKKPAATLNAMIRKKVWRFVRCMVGNPCFSSFKDVEQVFNISLKK
jgi:hypothetical protein